jgi:hypothetical protein
MVGTLSPLQEVLPIQNRNTQNDIADLYTIVEPNLYRENERFQKASKPQKLF